MNIKLLSEAYEKIQKTLLLNNVSPFQRDDIEKFVYEYDWTVSRHIYPLFENIIRDLESLGIFVTVEENHLKHGATEIEYKVATLRIRVLEVEGLFIIEPDFCSYTIRAKAVIKRLYLPDDQEIEVQHYNMISERNLSPVITDFCLNILHKAYEENKGFSWQNY